MSSPGLALRLSPSVISTHGVNYDITDVAEGWHRTIKQQGGYYTGSFSITAPEEDISTLSNYFYTWLGMHFVEYYDGAITWEGMVYEMDLTFNGSTRRRSFDDMQNKLKVRYTNDKNEQLDTSWASNAASIARYSTKEDIITVGQMTQAQAESIRDRILKEKAWPWARPVGVKIDEEADVTLTVTLMGYYATANWLFADRSMVDSAGEISDIITAVFQSLQFLTGEFVAPNVLEIQRRPKDDIRAGDWLQQICKFGDSSNNPYQITTLPNRHIAYKKMETTPAYYLRNDGVYGTGGSPLLLEPWVVKPGVFREVTYPVAAFEYDSWLDDLRDFVADEVEVGVNTGLSLKAEAYEDSEIMIAQSEARESGTTTGSQATSGNKKNWYEDYAKIHKMNVKDAQKAWQSMSLAQRIQWKKTTWKEWNKNKEKKKKRKKS